MIGAYIVANQPMDIIDSIEDLVKHKDMTPTILKGSAFENIFQV